MKVELQIYKQKYIITSIVPLNATEITSGWHHLSGALISGVAAWAPQALTI